MIYNRTLEDVENAKSIITEKVKKFLPLSQDEIDVLEKGTMTTSTLNRIENKQSELKSLLNNMGYFSININNKIWDETQIFNINEFERILNNLDILRGAFFTYQNTPQTPRVSYHWEDVNSLEKILFDLEEMTNSIKSNYKFCGNFKCGGNEIG